MKTATSIASDFKEIEQAYTRLRAIASLPAQQSEERKPAISGWCALEHVAHVSLANELIVRNLSSLAAGFGPLVQSSGEPANGALEILDSGVIPRGRAQSPRMVRPPVHIDRALLAEWIETGAAGFSMYAGRLESLLAAQGRIPHQLLGPLTAAQWVRFAAIHTRHHLAIAAEVLGARAP